MAGDNRRLRLVVVGHVDHGKSTLIGRLLLDTNSLPADKVGELRAWGGTLGQLDPAFVTDSLGEERTRGVTIDTTQVFFRTASREYAIIDTPGHRGFLKNMFTGATRADAAVLVVDAAEGIREQTVWHAEILRMVGVEQLLVAVNKMDAVGFDGARFEALSRELEGLLGGLDVMAVVPLSALEGDNVARRSEKTGWYCGPTILTALDALDDRSQAENLPLRMPIQDIYGARGKRIFVGRVESGRIAAGDRIVFQPSGRFSVVESLKNPGREEVQEARAGQSVGLNLTDGLAATRGEIICHENTPIPVTRCVEGYVFWFAKMPLVRGKRLLLRCATQDVRCTADAIAGRQDLMSESLETATELKEAELGTVVLTTDRPIASDRFRDIPQLGRFVLADRGRVAGAGIVLSQKGRVGGAGL